VIRELVAEGTTVLLTTQNMEEADQLTHHIAVIDHGQVIATGTPDELKAKLGGQVLEVRPADPTDLERAADLLTDLTGSQATVDPDVHQISVPMPDPAWLPVAVRRLDEAAIVVIDLVATRRRGGRGRTGAASAGTASPSAYPGSRSSAGLPYRWRQELKETPQVNSSTTAWQPAPGRPCMVAWQRARRSRPNMASSCRRASAVSRSPVACA
jgi:oleandomycin transport system ATP-binding protein